MEIGLRAIRPLRRGMRGALEFGEHRLQHFGAAQRAAPDIGIDILGLGQAQFLGHFADGLVGQFGALVGEDLFQNLAGRI